MHIINGGKESKVPNKKDMEETMKSPMKVMSEIHKLLVSLRESDAAIYMAIMLLDRVHKKLNPEMWKDLDAFMKHSKIEAQMGVVNPTAPTTPPPQKPS